MFSHKSTLPNDVLLVGILDAQSKSKEHLEGGFGGTLKTVNGFFSGSSFSAIYIKNNLPPFCQRGFFSNGVFFSGSSIWYPSNESFNAVNSISLNSGELPSSDMALI
jgi:hypothetical protein